MLFLQFHNTHYRTTTNYFYLASQVYVMHMFRGVWRKKLGAGPDWSVSSQQRQAPGF
jgi:hypothetical protein